MTGLQHIKNVYLLGAGGIGMSGLARYFKAAGAFVAGYDKTPTPLTSELIAEGIEVHFTDDPQNIPAQILHTPKSETLYIYTPAIPKDSKELNFLKAQGTELKKRSEVLGMITDETYSICIAGTHGKTTTTALTAHILVQCEKNPTAFIGGILNNYHSNFILSNNSEITVTEADEFDRSFLTLSPNIAVITSMDADHLDIYGDHIALLKSFQDFISKIKPGGCLIIHENVAKNAITNNRIISYGTSGNADYNLSNVHVLNGRFYFDIVSKNQTFAGFELQMPGLHNLQNALAAFIASQVMEIPSEKVRNALANFTGVKRRFEFIVNKGKRIYIDDYAHHPSEIDACISAAKMLYPGRKITVIFQPHLYSRTRDFADGFAKSLSAADELILLNIYPARELPMPGIESDIIFNKVTSPLKTLIQSKELLGTLQHKANELDVLLTVGAGDIDQFIPEIKNLVESVNTIEKV